MKTIATYLAIALLVPTMAVAQYTAEKNPYLLQAPYDGLHGRIDSVVQTTYLLKESVNPGELLQAKDNLQKIDLLKGELSEITVVAYDTNGYFTNRRESKVNQDHELEITSKWEVKRDANSLPTHIIFRTPTDGTVTDFKLFSRQNGVETYRTPRQGGNIPSINTQVEQIIEYKGDTLSTTRIYPSGYQTRYIYVYDANRQNVYWTDKMEGEDNFVEYFSTYTPDGLLAQTERKTFDINQKQENLASNKIVSYQYLLFQPSQGHSNWTHRLLTDQTGKPIGIEVQTIYYWK